MPDQPINLRGIDKFGELLLHIAQRCAEDPGFGSTKLNKLLWFCDFEHYRQHGKPITHASYQKLVNGPAPKPLLPTLNRLKGEGAVRIEIRRYYGYPQKRVFALRESEMDRFAEDERHTIDSVLEACEQANGTDLSDFSHTFPCWQVAANGETIPYESYLVEAGEPTELHISVARQLLPRLRSRCTGA